jgi:hypothetical protein
MGRLADRYLEEVLAGHKISVNMADADELCEEFNLDEELNSKASSLNEFRQRMEDVKNRIEFLKQQIRKEWK